jgi:hypothetical protein
MFPRDESGRLRLKCDGTRAETSFRLSAKRTSPFKSAGASVQSTTGSRGVRISGTLMLDTPCSEVVWRILDTLSIRHFPLYFPPPLASPVPSHFNWTLIPAFLPYTSLVYTPEICGVYAHFLKTAINGGWRCKEVFYQIYRFTAAFTGHKFISSNLNWRVHCRTGFFFI